MWTVNLPFKPGTKVFIPRCNEIGTWHVEPCVIKSYTVKSDTDIEVMVLTGKSNKYSLVKLENLCAMEADADRKAKELKEAWEKKKRSL